jgi:predicted PurR-regulated permease PerM
MAEQQQSNVRPPSQARSWGSITIQLGWSSILLVIGLIALTYLLFRIPHFWLIVVSALVLATAIDKPVSAMQRRGIPRAFGILLIYLVLIAFFAAAIGALAPIVAGDARALEREIPGYVDRFQSLVAPISGGEQGLSVASLGEAAREHASGLAQGATEIGLEVGRTAFYVFVTLVVAFFLAADPEVLLRLLERFVPVRHRTRVVRVATNIHERIGTWARGQLLIAIIFGTLMGIGLRLIGVPYALSLGVVAGILEIVPYVGGAITVVLAVFSAATVGIPQIVGAIVLYVILVNLESHILAPLLYGRALGFPPVAILLALLAGVELLGILGALLAVPLTVIVWAISDEFLPNENRGMNNSEVELQDAATPVPR